MLRPVEVTKPILERYQRFLFYRRKRDGKPLTFGAQLGKLVPIRTFFKWLARENIILHNPAGELELPRREQRLPKHVLTSREAENVLAQPDPTTVLGLRDRALLETLYSTGARRLELANLKMFDLDVERKTLSIRQGKGRKDRTVPIGERAVAWVQKYLVEARPQLVVAPDEGFLFIGQFGNGMCSRHITAITRRYVMAAKLGKTGACHLFRHTMATLMLENGADIRFIQQMLGHADLHTTEIYTRVSIKKLQEIHAATHPAARLLPRRKRNGDDQDEAEPEPTEDELFAQLDQEAKEEADEANKDNAAGRDTTPEL